MGNRTLAELDRVVALGGGHGLGRVMSSLSFLGPRLTGIVTTTDNGGSTGRIRRSEGGIAWGDTRNCLNQLITAPSMASAMFEYRFSGNGELSGHNLGNLMLKAMDHLSVRPLEAINLIRNLLKVDALLIPMSEQPVDLMAIDALGNPVYGEVAVDQLAALPQDLMLYPTAPATQEALTAIAEADLILIGPGSFLTSLMPPLLLTDLAQSLHHAHAPVVYIGNLGDEQSQIATRLTLAQKLQLIESKIDRRIIDAVVVAPRTDTRGVDDRLIIQQPLGAQDVPHHHDRVLLRAALELAAQALGLCPAGVDTSQARSSTQQ
ncbi:Putative gluconeogenesis factor [Dickeya dianthicola]|uniref:Putative gluconeogenesis factor n=1 Tax=Dickeya dianthicola TaxID=204039 RepID=A0AAP2GE06_9GAMM|nr:uridine diphosphate-N-acetylglucosamine-binding protein YvcK [Dickeya dianthicola]ATO32666.1 LppG [Dickeya dianthicola RNS04.9]AYC18638.1 Putative gluconeogenesis factor [Dickeya dianthicola]MBI0440087.1 uridine diphosphate-N-acetylglucosamine-binding protein YvcK [Dickeya dianthicola]MBI0451039.1 uridine diphosphate-N-acetylglucosamine-binding protein YvcK [Dickeya dianthicola]MBI0455507.1 uridine diphosphate-N-acetylglucosamine-binding protein YvcK [Dickeya dianthicola]